MLNKTEAQRLQETIVSSLLDFEKAIVEFVTGEGWTPLGYPTLAAWWASELTGKGINLRVESAANIVVCAMYDEGATPEQVAQTIDGVGPQTAQIIHRKHMLGVPPEHIRVREHVRKAERAPAHIVHVSVPVATYDRWVEIAKRHGTTVTAESEIALRSHFAALGAEAR